MFIVSGVSDYICNYELLTGIVQYTGVNTVNYLPIYILMRTVVLIQSKSLYCTAFYPNRRQPHHTIFSPIDRKVNKTEFFKAKLLL